MSNSSKAWLRRHLTDPFVKEAQRLGYASRAAFKLLSIQEKDKIFITSITIFYFFIKWIIIKKPRVMHNPNAALLSQKDLLNGDEARLYCCLT